MYRNSNHEKFNLKNRCSGKDREQLALNILAEGTSNVRDDNIFSNNLGDGTNLNKIFILIAI
jgi:hypothetical protein